MKKIISTLLICMVGNGFIFAQAPSSFKYQSVVRDVSGNIIPTQVVKFRINLLKGSIGGSSSFSEIHTTATNQFGIANLEIGNGSSQVGSIDTIQWGNADYFIKIELDPTGSSGYTDMGTTQLLSVPYALYANNAGNVPKIVAGSSDLGLAPVITSGSGFTITHTSTGMYYVAFNIPFAVIPTVVFNSPSFALTNGATDVWVTDITVNGMILNILYSMGYTDNSYPFSFIATGN